MCWLGGIFHERLEALKEVQEKSEELRQVKESEEFKQLVVDTEEHEVRKVYKSALDKWAKKAAATSASEQ